LWGCTRTVDRDASEDDEFPLAAKEIWRFLYRQYSRAMISP
jgi:hypothetical protein